jgi:threonine/homoserine/homoserine lactone efflux protein
VLASLLAFTAVAALLTLSPGPDLALVLRTAIAAGRSRAMAAAVGIVSGCYAWGIASAAGITALLSASRIGYDVLRVVGAAYLIWLGVQTLRDARRPHGEDTTAGADLSVARAYRTGLLTNLLNPKVGVVYLSLLPAFVPSGAPVLATTLLLVTVHIVLGLLWLGTVAQAVHWARGVLSRARVRRRLEQVSGTVLVGLGVGLALDTSR